MKSFYACDEGNPFSVKVELQDPKLIRRPAYAGDAYPSDPVELSETIDSLIDGTRRPQSTKGDLRALVSPTTSEVYTDHAFFAGLRTLRGKHFDTIIVLAMSQQVFFDYASVYKGGSYDTPLGRVFVDLELARDLSERHPRVVMSGVGHTGGPRQEFGIEILLPALQKLLGDFKVVPIIIGSDDDTTGVAVGEVLSSVRADQSSLLIGGVNLLENDELSADLRGRIVNSILARDLNRTTERIRAAQVSGASPLLSIMYATARTGVSEIILPRADGSEADDTVEDLSSLSVVFMK
jgi:hypothetical protein